VVKKNINTRKHTCVDHVQLRPTLYNSPRLQSEATVRGYSPVRGWRGTHTFCGVRRHTPAVAVPARAVSDCSKLWRLELVVACSNLWSGWWAASSQPEHMRWPQRAQRRNHSPRHDALVTARIRQRKSLAPSQAGQRTPENSTRSTTALAATALATTAPAATALAVTGQEVSRHTCGGRILTCPHNLIFYQSRDLRK
jgi:hypothetical protein